MIAVNLVAQRRRSYSAGRCHWKSSSNFWITDWCPQSCHRASACTLWSTLLTVNARENTQRRQVIGQHVVGIMRRTRR